ncbi:GAF and ANTAR domain-containing protein [Microlunatus soli]|uniref:GAF domain-containing protein n=1 Tax=Microlunatus soli TaxID=630515 RepID=A0A1H1N2J1_9ACTN|nr:GAF and ANTAR domain-containing protein [Microlunatus soli]SDR93182.1 GAF domain-containing protein [Microlunatus soli]
MLGEDNPELKYATEFARLAEQLHQEPREQPTLERIAGLAVETIDACDYCGISLRDRDGRITTPASTSPISSRADALQYELAEGPCVDAIWQADTYLIDSLRTESRWPRWTPRAAELGIGSILSVRLSGPNEQAVAALNLYSVEAHVFDHTDVAIASIYARHASRALADARTREGLETALESRQMIGVAQGILVQRFGLNLDQSFELLRRYSRDYNIKLRVLAENLVRNKGIRDDLDVADAVARSFDLAVDQPRES